MEFSEFIVRRASPDKVELNAHEWFQMLDWLALRDAFAEMPWQMQMIIVTQPMLYWREVLEPARQMAEDYLLFGEHRH